MNKKTIFFLIAVSVFGCRLTDIQPGIKLYCFPEMNYGYYGWYKYDIKEVFIQSDSTIILTDSLTIFNALDSISYFMVYKLEKRPYFYNEAVYESKEYAQFWFQRRNYGYYILEIFECRDNYNISWNVFSPNNSLLTTLSGASRFEFTDSTLLITNINNGSYVKLRKK